ncbi:MAG: peptidylprolyl isomerase [Chitinophagaceae bacterium]|nr:peptidylprolyl isomerase [Chitinophagaceae bacterium]
MKSSTASCDRRKSRDKSPFLVKQIGFAAICLFFVTTGIHGQTLFTYGKHAVSKDEFLHAYNKNNSDTNAIPISYADYLELYSRFKLKVQSAKDAGMDTTSTQLAELESFRYQLADNFLKDEATIQLLVDEAFERSKKDINLSYILVRTSADTGDTKTAKERIDEAYKRLQAGEDFETVGASYEHGSVGYITVFVLPYILENAAYSTPVGKYSEPVQHSSGFYIFRNNHERKAAGQVRVAQILLAFHPGMSEEARNALGARADSLYANLIEGGIFADSARAYSNDNLTYQNGGEMAAFGVGQFDTLFTNTAFSLQKDGDISSPIKTVYGYHILQRLQRIEVIDDPKNEGNMNMLKEKVMQSDRIQFAQAILVKKIRETIRKDAKPADLATDSSVIEYYRGHLENYNTEFAEQLKEFREGNLLFGIMQKKVWDAATDDSVALKNYFDQNKNRYNWEMSADAIIITCTDPQVVDSIQTLVKNDLSLWRKLADQSNGMVQADSGRFELSQIPVAGRTNFTEGLITAPVTNDQDSSKTFAYIIRMHNEKEPKSFDDAKGSVINDYQAFLEEQWVAELKKKYPVKVNKKVFKRLPAKN